MKKALSFLLAVILSFCALSLTTTAQTADVADVGANITITMSFDSTKREATAKWNAVSGATRYYIKLENNDENGSWDTESIMNYALVNSGQTQYTFSNSLFDAYLNGGMQYKVMLKAYSGDNQIAYGEKIFTTGMKIVPSTSSVNLTNSGIISWSAVSAAEYYNVHLYKAGGTLAFSVSGDFDGCRYDASNYVDKGSYYYATVSCKTKGCRYSKEVSSATVVMSGEKTTITGIKWEGRKLTWDKKPGASSYSLILKKKSTSNPFDPYGEYVQNGSAQVTNLTYFDFTSLLAAYGYGTYKVTIEAFDSSLKSASKATTSGTLEYSEENESTFTVSGELTSYLEEYYTTYFELLQNDTVKYNTLKNGTTGQFSFFGVKPGYYTLRVSKAYHATRDYSIYVNGNTTQNVKIHPIGDISGDGRITSKDFAMAYAHAQKLDTLTGYALKCGDVVKNDGQVKTADAARIYAHAQKLDLLW